MSDEQKPLAPAPAPEVVDDKPKTKMTWKKRRFADELAKTGEPMKALARSYPSTRTEGAKHVQVARLLKDPGVLSRVDQLLKERYPDHEGAFAQLLQRATELAQNSSELTPEMIKLLEFFAKIKGYSAPTVHQRLTVKAKLPQD